MVGRDGFHLDLDRIRHVRLDALTCNNVLTAADARHLVSQRNALRLRRDDDVVLRALFHQRFCGLLGDLYIAEHNKTGNIQRIADRADRQLAFAAGDRHLINFTHCKNLPSKIIDFRYMWGISPEATP